MKSKLIITKMQQGVLCALFEDDKIAELRMEPLEETSILGNIYVGKVKNIVPNIHAAFVEIWPDMPCYLPLSEEPNLVYTTKTGKKGLCVGDEILVQVSKEAVKTKVPSVTADIQLTGKYLVLTKDKKCIGLSAKLTKEEKKRLGQLFSDCDVSQRGFIVRTNARDGSREDIKTEAIRLTALYEQIRQTASYRTPFSRIYETPPAYLQALRDVYSDSLEKIVTDDSHLYETMKAYLSVQQPEDMDKLSFYQDAILPLHKLYSLETEIEHATSSRVWLKSGGYLIMQQTEALYVVDVNTGKFEGKKKSQDTFLKINLEAAREIARQLRLRNISGIILVDFINMEDKAYQQQLLDFLNKELKRDPIKTVLVDMTPLELVEITRKKVRKPFSL